MNRPSTAALHAGAQELRDALLNTWELRAWDVLHGCRGLAPILSVARELSTHLEGPRPVVEHLVNAGLALDKASKWTRCKGGEVLLAGDLDTMRAELAAAELCHRWARRAS